MRSLLQGPTEAPSYRVTWHHVTTQEQIVPAGPYDYMGHQRARGLRLCTAGGNKKMRKWENSPNLKIKLSILLMQATESRPSSLPVLRVLDAFSRASGITAHFVKGSSSILQRRV